MTDWKTFFHNESAADYYQKIQSFVTNEKLTGKTVYPPQELVFNAFDRTPYEKVKVVILGQDPYHGAGQAHGLAFSVLKGVKIPPSLRNIYKELQSEYQWSAQPADGELSSWSDQGVLLLNTVLTVEEGKAHSHARCGWEQFTDRVVEQLNQHERSLVFLLWGAHAQKKGAMIDTTKHLVLKAAHPSPLSACRGFMGCGHFSKANEWLSSRGEAPINWWPE